MSRFRSKRLRRRMAGPHFPERLAFQGRVFRRARWRRVIAGVSAQYRQEVAQNSAHLMICTDGRWVIDHIDQDNPDMGRELPHFLNDTGIGRAVKVAAPLAMLVGICWLTGRAVRSG